mmetsp:Transcript_102731/g.209272  ORF Transcript_102731/g.209272 Transcript_102731/m.209272 type:complete len:221 (+) Transcript_102731:295-957(+)
MGWCCRRSSRSRRGPGGNNETTAATASRQKRARPVPSARGSPAGPPSSGPPPASGGPSSKRPWPARWTPPGTPASGRPSNLLPAGPSGGLPIRGSATTRRCPPATWGAHSRAWWTCWPSTGRMRTRTAVATKTGAPRPGRHCCRTPTSAGRTSTGGRSWGPSWGRGPGQRPSRPVSSTACTTRASWGRRSMPLSLRCCCRTRRSTRAAVASFEKRSSGGG